MKQKKMVSTRGMKFKFSSGERVLCYEPDPTKAKVLYDSKVLDIVVQQNSRGRKLIEYLIHFQGWNSSWDRCVSEDYVLKDTDENRELQRDLSRKAQILFQEQKKRKRRQNNDSNEPLSKKARRQKSLLPKGSAPKDDDRLEDTSDEEGSKADSAMTPDENVSDDESNPDRPRIVPLELPDVLKKKLENDYYSVMQQNKLVRLPAEPNVVAILENYVHYFAVNSICRIPEKTQGSRRRKGDRQSDSSEQTYWNINLCKEMVDGVRVFMDFTVGDVLLYDVERQQFTNLSTFKPVICKIESTLPTVEQKTEANDVPPSTETNTRMRTRGRSDTVTSPANNKKEELVPETMVKRLLRSRRPLSASDTSESSVVTDDAVAGRFSSPTQTNSSFGEGKGDAKPVSKLSLRYTRLKPCVDVVETVTPDVPLSSVGSTCSDRSTSASNLDVSLPLGTGSASNNELLKEVLNWRLVPTSVYDECPPPPSLVYGAIHLARLFVKLPEMLYHMNMPEKKLKVLMKHIHMFLEYLSNRDEWFAESCYTDNSERKQ